MKKIFMLLTAAVLCAGSAWAQSDTVSITSFEKFADIDDGTFFKYESQAVVTYQKSKYLFVRSIVEKTEDDGTTSYYSYPALLYGSAKQTYTNGDLIPAGWTAKKTTYKGMTEATTLKNMAASTSKIADADVLAAPVDYTGYISYLTQSDFFTLLAGEYMSFTGVYITDIYRKEITIAEYVNGVKSEMSAYNQFSIKLPSDYLDIKFDITGFYYIEDNKVKFLPTSIQRHAIDEHLYTAVFGDDGEDYRISDELFVIEPTKAEEKEESSSNYIYVTDNMWEIDYHGYTFEWVPTYIAIDCQGNQTLYDKIAAMRAIKGGTLMGTLASSKTNPRLLVTEAPTASDSVSELRYRYVDLSDSIVVDGHDVISVLATYRVIDGQEYLIGYDEQGGVYQPMKLDRRYMGDVQLIDGDQYVFDRVVVKLQEPWNTSDPIKAQAVNGFSIRPLSVAQAPSRMPRRMNPNDPRYSDNIVLCPLEGTPVATSVSEVSAIREVSSVEYIDLAGHTSATPHDGINIVVTRYTDGTTQATKVIK